MCGIVGAAGILTANEEKAFKSLLILDTFRGEDSTGIASVSPDGDVIVSKCVGTPYELLPRYVTERIFARANRVLIGHNRYATQGAVNSRNAHPFEFDTLVGVHNGTLKERYKLKHQTSYTVDSEQLYANIDEDGEDVTIPKVVGAYTLVWWDKANEKLKMVRNKERPMYYTFNEAGSAMFWASEEWMLTISLARTGIKHRAILPLEEDQLYTFEVGVNPVERFSAVTFEKKELKQAPLPQATTYYGAYGASQQVRGTVVSGSVQHHPIATQPQGASQVGKNETAQKPVTINGNVAVDENIGQWVCVTLSGYIINEGGQRYLGGYDNILKVAVRLYHSDYQWLNNLVGKKVEAKIMGKTKDIRIYILNPSSVVTEEMALAEGLQESLEEVGEVVDVVVEENTTFDSAREIAGKEVRVYDHNNHEVSVGDFLHRYSTCSNCGTNIFFGDLYRPLDHNSCLCADCIEVFQL